MTEKLQKVLARAGLGSRRSLEDIISAGRVSINGQVAELGDRVTADDEVRVDGRKIQIQAERELRRRVILYYKPEGEICSRHDPEGRPTVFDSLPTISRERWVMVGRLDINSTGLLLFTNDGELANRLMHPSSEIEREYSVRVMGEVTPQVRQNLLRGVQLEDGLAKFESFVDAGGEGINRWYKVVVKEGRNREVRRLFESQGLRVSRLLRIRYGVIHLPREIRTGRWLELDQLAINELAKSVDLSAREGVKFDENAQRRIDKMLNNPMKARHVEQRYSRPSIPEDTGEKRYNSYSEYRQAHKQQRANTTSSERVTRDDERSERPSRDFGDRNSRQNDRSSRNFDDRNHRQDNRSSRDFGDRNSRQNERSSRNFDDRNSRQENRSSRDFGDRNHRQDNRSSRDFDDRNYRQNERSSRNFDDRNSRQENRSSRSYDDRSSHQNDRSSRNFGDRNSRQENRSSRGFDDRSSRQNDRSSRSYDDRNSRQENRSSRNFDDRNSRQNERSSRDFGDRNSRQDNRSSRGFDDRNSRQNERSSRDFGDRNSRQNDRSSRDFGDRKPSRSREHSSELSFEARRKKSFRR